MSVIVAKSTVCCGTSSSVTTYDCFPAVSIEQLISHGSSAIVDGISIASFSAAHWHVYITNNAQTRVVSYKVTAVQNGSSSSFNMYALLGDLTIAVVPSVSTVGGILSISFANNDSEDFLVCVTRTAVPTDHTQSTPLQIVEIGTGRSFVRSGTQMVLDFIDGSIGVDSIHWVLTLTDGSGNRLATQLLAIFGSSIDAVEFGTIGDNLQYQLTVTDIPGIGTELSIDNTDVVDYRVNLTRVPVQVQSGIPYCGANDRGLSLMTPSATTIASLATMSIDTISLPAHTCARWLATITNTTTNQTMACEILATMSSSGPLIDVYGNVGAHINLTFTASSAGGLSINVLNREANSIVVNLLRVPTQA